MSRLIRSLCLIGLSICGVGGILPHAEAQTVDWQANWVWVDGNGPDNAWVAFRKEVNVDSVPSTTIANISADTKYWLWINGELVVFEGSYTGGSSPVKPGPRVDNVAVPTNRYYDRVDIQPYLKTGKNTIAILTWYWGQNGSKGTHTDSGKGALIFQADIGGTKVITDGSWKAKRHPGYAADAPKDSNGRIAAWGIKYDARKSLGDWTANAWYTEGYNDDSWDSATTKGKPPIAPWNKLELSEIPPLKNWGLANCKNYPESKFPFTSDGGTITCTLDFNKNFTPYFEIESDAGKQIKIDSSHGRNTIETIYFTKSGRQRFESFSWLNGHDIEFTIPAGIKVHDLKFRWTGVGDVPGTFESDNAWFERIWQMAENTLYICARDNFMDTPDRERGLWIGDVADQSSYLFYSMDQPGRDLLKKGILVTMKFSDADSGIFAGLGPGRFRELPAQSLQFIEQSIWQYYWNTGDKETLEFAYPYVHRYLTLWNMQSNGLPNFRNGAWRWTDWGPQETIDYTPIQNALYYSGLVAAKKMAEVLGRNDHMSFYNNRINSIKTAYNKEFWQNGFYSSDPSKFKDDRTNGLAILVGLADSDKYPAIVDNVLIPVNDASPHFEWMVESAMAIAGRYDDALTRMKKRYKTQLDDSSLTTLSEYLPDSERSNHGGTKNHAWNAPSTVLSKYIAGVSPTAAAWREYEVLPNLAQMSRVKQVVPSVQGMITTSIERVAGAVNMTLDSPENTTAILGVPKKGIDIALVKINDTIVWSDGTYQGGVPGVSWVGEESKYLKFKLSPGAFSITATGTDTDTPVDPGTPQDLPAGYVLAAAENETVNVTGKMDIAFGADGQYFFLYGQTANVLCHRDIFGDPIKNVRKQCYTKDAVVNTPPVITGFESPVLVNDTFTVNEDYQSLYVVPTALESDVGDNIAKVELYIDGVLHPRPETGAPYEWGKVGSEFETELLNLTPGMHTIEARATDSKGAVGKLSFNLSVEAKVIPTPNVAPDLNFTQPVATTIESGENIALVELNATDSDGTVTSVSLYINNMLIGTVDANPYRWVNLPELMGLQEGTLVLEAIAMDDDDAQTKTSLTVTVNKKEEPNEPTESAGSIDWWLMILAWVFFDIRVRKSSGCLR